MVNSRPKIKFKPIQMYCSSITVCSSLTIVEILKSQGDHQEFRKGVQSLSQVFISLT